jgi:hypothetical protein
MEGNLLKVYALSDQMFWSERHGQKKRVEKRKEIITTVST